MSPIADWQDETFIGQSLAETLSDEKLEERMKEKGRIRKADPPPRRASADVELWRDLPSSDYGMASKTARQGELRRKRWRN